MTLLQRTAARSARALTHQRSEHRRCALRVIARTFLRRALIASAHVEQFVRLQTANLKYLRGWQRTVNSRNPNLCWTDRRERYIAIASRSARPMCDVFFRGQAATEAGLGVNAGHDLNRGNLADFLAAVPGVLEVSIGHALVCDALELGYRETVLDYLRCIARAEAQ